jgi:hypothetical protein
MQQVVLERQDEQKLRLRREFEGWIWVAAPIYDEPQGSIDIQVDVLTCIKALSKETLSSRKET